MPNQPEISNKDRERLLAGGITAGTLGGVAAVNNYNKTKLRKFTLPEHVNDYLKDIKKGDVIFINDDHGNKLHPLIITDPDTYDYSEHELKQWVKDKKVTNFAPKETIRPYRLKGRYMDFGPGGLAEGSLEGKLHEVLQARKREGQSYIYSHDPSKSHLVGDIYRPKELNPDEFDNLVKSVKSNEKKFTYKFPLGEMDFKNFQKCQEGTCVVFANEFYNNLLGSKDKVINPASLIDEAKFLKITPKGKSSIPLLTPLLLGLSAAAGTGYALSRNKKKDEYKKNIAIGGAGLAGTSLLFRKKLEGLNAGFNVAKKIGINSTITSGAKAIGKSENEIDKLENVLDHSNVHKVIGTGLFLPAAYVSSKKLIEEKK